MTTQGQVELLDEDTVSALDTGAEGIQLAWDNEHWRVRGYESWATYFTEVFGAATSKIVKVAQRQGKVKLLAEARDDEGLGMSTRDIAAAVGVAKATVDRDVGALAQMGHLDRPDDVRGKDGKAQPSSRPKADKTPRSPKSVWLATMKRVDKDLDDMLKLALEADADLKEVIRGELEVIVEGLLEQIKELS